jgi:hypothetical protein
VSIGGTASFSQKHAKTSHWLAFLHSRSKPFFPWQLVAQTCFAWVTTTMAASPFNGNSSGHSSALKDARKLFAAMTLVRSKPADSSIRGLPVTYPLPA